MGTRSARLWYVVAAVVAFVVLIAGWFLLVSPAKTNAAEITDQTAQVQSNNLMTQQKIVQLQSQSKEVPALEAQVAAVRNKIPTNPALATLVRSLSSQAKNSGVVLVSVTPSSPAQGEGALSTIPVEVKVTGEFANVQMFLNNLERMQRAFLVQNVDMNRAADPETATNDLDATISGSVFMSTSFDAPAAAAPADAAPATAN